MTQDTKIEVVRLYRFEGEGPVKAFCDIQFDEDYVVKGFRIVEGEKGLFLGMPSNIGKNSRWYNIFLPLSDEVKSRLAEVAITAYQE